MWIILKLMLGSREAMAALWIFGAMVAVLLGCLCVALRAALFGKDPDVKHAGRRIFELLLRVLTKDRGQ